LEGVTLKPLKKIFHPKGDIYHGIKKTDTGFVGFGEAYFSAIDPGQIKGWNRHKRMTINLIVPIGSVKFVVSKAINDLINHDNIIEVELSIQNYQRLTVPPGFWIGFKCTSKIRSFILNIADMEHDPNEIERIDLEKMHYNW
jgi:dTDP-4-dehydrorhamnose 3,5-epimerase